MECKKNRLVRLVAILLNIGLAGCSTGGKGNSIESLLHSLKNDLIVEGMAIEDAPFTLKENAVYVKRASSGVFYTTYLYVGQSDVVMLYAYDSELYGAVSYSFGGRQEYFWHFLDVERFKESLDIGKSVNVFSGFERDEKGRGEKKGVDP